MTEYSCDLFLTHAWRYHEDWTQATAMLDAVEDLSWRNFSVPWHDPAMDANSEVGGRFIREWLETQIIPVDAVILLAGVYRIGSARKWLDLELKYAAQHNKVVLGMPAFGATVEDFPSDLRPAIKAVVPWDGRQFVEILDKLLDGRRQADILS